MEENINMTEDIHTEKKSSYPWIIFTALVAIGGYLLYSQYQPAGNVMPAQSTSYTQVRDTSMPAVGSTDSGSLNSSEKVIEIEAGSFYYKPNVIEVKKGEKVKIIMKSVDMMHDFIIDELGVKMSIVKSGSVGEIDFTADMVGEFEFYCSVGQHRANGQTGILKVTE